MPNRNDSVGIQQFMSEIAEHAPLTPSEELELFSYLGRTGDPKAREQAILRNLRLVLYVAKKHQGHGVDLEDLMQEGTVGLMVAVDRFKHELGWRFSTYAMWWIKQAVLRAIMIHGTTVRLPAYLLEELHQFKKVLSEVRGSTGDVPTLEEIVAHSGETSAVVRDWLNQMSRTTVSFDDGRYGRDHNTSPSEILSSGEIPPGLRLQAREEVAATRQLIAITLGQLEVLPISDRDKEIFKRHTNLGFGSQPKTLKSIAGEFDITPERVRQICGRVWDKLRIAGCTLNAKLLVRELKRIEDIQRALGEKGTHSNGQ